jgi:tetratricopeptide (TPR) repeat protein
MPCIETCSSSPDLNNLTAFIYRPLLLTLVILTLSATFVTTSAQNQISQDFIIGTQLMRQGQHERAAEIFAGLVEKNPSNFMYLEQYILALSNLKQYDKAIQTVETYLSMAPSDVMTTTRLANIYHISGDIPKAFEIWNRVLTMEPGNPNVPRIVSESMQDRREFDKAAEVLQEARKQYDDQSLFLFELANIYLIAGKYSLAAREYNSILLQYPDRLQFIQRQYSRFNDMELVDAAIIESDESIRTLPIGDERIAMMREFQIWLLLERGLYRRAIATARNMDVESGQKTMALFNVGQRLAGQNEFELSEQALKVYADNTEHPLSARSGEELASVYMRWARYLITNNLDTGEKVDSLYTRADSTLRKIRAGFPGYQRRSQVALLQTELALDYLKDGELARQWLNDMTRFGEAEQYRIERQYLEGRILMFDGRFNEARVLLTRANTEARIGDVAEKTRYFLALTDFYSKDYEFASIQLKALERQNASLYANDALQLRLWIMDGRNKDSTTTQIDLFSSAMFSWMKNDVTKAAELSRQIVIEHAKHPLADDALMLLSRTMRYEDPLDALTMIDDFIRSSTGSAMTEQLLWERILLTNRLKSDPTRMLLEMQESQREMAGQQDKQLADVDFAILQAARSSNNQEVWDSISRLNSNFKIIENTTLNLFTEQGYTEILEDLLIRFPQGFYSGTARDQLRSLKQNL